MNRSATGPFSAPGLSAPGASRALMGAVIVMGVLIVLGTAGLIGVVVHRVSHRMAAAPVGAEAAEASLPVPAGTQIVSVTPRGDGSVLIHLRAGERDRVVLWNPEAGRVAASLTLRPEP